MSRHLTSEGTVVLTAAEYERLLAAAEDAADRRAVAAAVAGEGVFLPLPFADRLLAGEHPVRVFRAWRRRTIADLAAAVGIGKSYLSQIETGRKEGSLEVYRKLADELGVTVDDLI